MEEIEELVNKIAESSLLQTGFKQEKNSVYLRGFILYKPSLIENGKKIVFSVCNIHKTQKGYSLLEFKCFSQAKTVMNFLQTLNNKVAYVSVYGGLVNVGGDSMPRITQIKGYRKTDLNLCEKGKKQNETKI